MKISVKQFSLITVIVLLLTTIATAEYTRWLGTTGNWSTDANWTSGKPDASDTALIYNSGTAQIISGYCSCYALYLGIYSGSSGIVDITGGLLSVGSGGIMVGDGGGNGTLDVTNGGAVRSSRSYIGVTSGATGVVTVDGNSSTWDNSNSILVGSSGNGLLIIANGGTVTNRLDTCVAYTFGSSGNISFNNGTLTTGGLLCNFDDITGTGTINTNGLLSDANIIFDAEHGLNQTLTINDNPGQNITLNLNVNGEGTMGAGYSGTGTLTISDGRSVSSTNGYTGYNIGFKPGSAGTVTIDGTGSRWMTRSILTVGVKGDGILNIVDGGEAENQYCNIGYDSGSTGKITVNGATSSLAVYNSLSVGGNGIGTLNVTNGGAITNSVCYIGKETGSTGTVSINGSDSKWTNRSDLYVGKDGNGMVNITDNGLVSVASILTIDYNGDDDSFINMATGGMLALNDSTWTSADDLDNFLALISSTDAILYWNGSAWANITDAIYAEDYTLEHITDGGDLDGYTVLTVNAPGPPDPDIDKDNDVDFQDFAKLASNWLEINCIDPDWCNKADIDHSSDVGILDMQILAEHWLE